jgi:hypothetical protein
MLVCAKAFLACGSIVHYVLYILFSPRRVKKEYTKENLQGM